MNRPVLIVVVIVLAVVGLSIVARNRSQSGAEASLEQVEKQTEAALKETRDNVSALSSSEIVGRTEQAAQQAANKAAQATQDAFADASAQALEQQKRIYEQSAEASLDQIDRRIQDLRARADLASPDQQQDLQTKLSELEQKRQEAQQRLTNFRQASAQDPSQQRSELERSLRELEDAFNEAREVFEAAAQPASSTTSPESGQL